MKVAILGDLHFGVRNDSSIFLDYQRKFFENVFFPTLEERGITTHIQMGDIVDNRKKLNYKTSEEASDMYFDECERRGIDSYMILGNHDIYYRESVKTNCWEEKFKVQYGDFFHGVQSPETIVIGGVKCDFIPWICKENQDEIARFIDQSTSKYLFGHLELSGFPMLRGIEALHGQSRKVFSKYDQVFTGHYHTFSEKGNIMYTGTPYELTWADCGDPKVFLIWDTVTGDIEKIQNPYRLFHKIIYDEGEIDVDRYDMEPYRHGYVRVIVQSKEDDDRYARFITRLHDEAEPVDVQITDVSVAYREVDIENVETQDPLTVMVKAIDDSSDLKKTDKETIRRDAMNLYSEALLEAKNS